MEKSKNNRSGLYKYICNIKPIAVLTAFYIIFTALRFIIGLFTSQNPIILPDENIYMNLARSIHESGIVSMRSQPVSYYTLLYSFVISPFFALPASVNIFRVVQLFNTVIMSLAVFPAFYIADRFLNNQKTAYAVALFSLFIPDMIMASRLMTEAFVYPIFLFAIFLMLPAFSDGCPISSLRASVCAIISFLLYLSKSGSIALVIAFSLYLIIYSIKNKDQKAIIKFAIFTGVFSLLYFVFRFICVAKLKIDPSVETIYNTYAPANMIEHISRTLPGMLLYIFYTIIAFGIFPILIPLASIKEFPNHKRRLIIFSVIVLAMYAAGACWMFYASETVGNFHAGRIHIRYLFPFMPLFFMFFLSPELKNKKPHGIMMLGVSYLIAVFATQSFTSILSGESYCVDAISLSYITFSRGDFNSRLFMQVVVMTFLLYMAYQFLSNGFGKKERNSVIIFMACTILLSNICGYVKCLYNTDERLTDDVQSTVSYAYGRKTTLILSNDTYFDNNLSVLDCSLRQSPYCINIDELCFGMSEYGKINSIVPSKYWTENPINPISLCDSYIMNGFVYNNAVIADGASCELSANGYYLKLSPNKDGKLFKSIMTNVSKLGELRNNSSVWLFDQSLLSNETVNIYLKVTASSAGTLTISTDTQSFYYNIDKNSEWIYGVYNVSGDGMKFSISSDTDAIKVLTYSFEK